MKILGAAIVGTALSLLALTPTVRANDKDDDVRYWSAVRGATVFESGMAVVPGTRIYYIVDDPKYDLSGSNETVYLVEDGSTYRAGAKGVPVALVKTSSGAHEVVAIPAEYRQSWMAVAAGDRPVRTVVPSRMVSTAVPTMIVVSSDRVYGTNGQPIYFDQRVRDNGRYRMTSTNGASSAQRATLPSPSQGIVCEDGVGEEASQPLHVGDECVVRAEERVPEWLQRRLPDGGGRAA
jgi:hypothetical protein